MTSTRESAPYVGRFAPSPTGPLHFGSLVAATASYLQARAHRGQWLLRIEDIDPPREQEGATAAILEALECYGFRWDGSVQYQSSSDPKHHAALQTLVEQDLAYRCSCSRNDLRSANTGALGPIYPGTCRAGCKPGDTAIRVRTHNDEIVVQDGLQGRLSQRLESESGDFVVARRDGLIAYHLAVVVDDHLQGVTEVVRGIDLFDSTPRQIWLQQLLGFATPTYQHIPVITHANGDKFSKLTGAKAIPLDGVEATLVSALDVLGQQPPIQLRTKKLAEIWTWAENNWEVGQLSGVRSIVKLA